MRRFFLCVNLLAFLACVVACGSSGESQGRSTRATADDKLQADRRKVIDKLFADGFLKDKIEVQDGSGVVWVTPAFMRSDFKDKQDAMSIVAAYLFKLPRGGSLRGGEIVVLFHSVTGKSVGTYSDAGLSLD